MRVVIAGTPVLCLLAAQPASAAWQPASAAWQTAASGAAGTEAGQLAAPAPITCTERTVEWPSAGGPVQYRVWFNGGKNPDVATSGTKTTAPGAGSGSVSVRVEAFVGTWRIEASTSNKICS